MKQNKTNKKSTRPNVAEPMHRNQKMDLNRMIDACFRTIGSGDTSSRKPGPVLPRLQDQDRDQPDTQVVRDHMNQGLHRHTSGPIQNSPKKPPLSPGVAMSAMIPAPSQIIRTSTWELKQCVITRYVPRTTVLADPAACKQRKSINNQ